MPTVRMSMQCNAMSVSLSRCLLGRRDLLVEVREQRVELLQAALLLALLLLLGGPGSELGGLLGRRTRRLLLGGVIVTAQVLAVSGGGGRGESNLEHVGT